MTEQVSNNEIVRLSRLDHNGEYSIRATKLRGIALDLLDARHRIAELERAVAKKFDADLMELSEEEFADFVESMREAREIYAARAAEKETKP